VSITVLPIIWWSQIVAITPPVDEAAASEQLSDHTTTSP
jgi:hypothetical protein